MKKKFIYPVFLLIFGAFAALIIINYFVKEKSKIVAFYPVKDRKGGQATSAEWASVKNTSANLIRIIRETPDDKKTALALATLYIQEARITGDHVYYDAAALKYINDVLKLDPENFDALILKSLIELSQHHFIEGLQTAEKARSLNPYNAFVYGILVDGYVETGDYTNAVANSDKMISLHPDIRSYSRVSYLREIHGDNEGAIKAMHMAVSSGGYGDEPTAWSRIQLARLYELTGDLKRAEMHYTIALDERPDYAYAIAGLGHLAMGKKDYATAITLYQKADSLVNDYTFREELAKLYFLSGDKKKAESIIEKVIAGMEKDAVQADDNEDIGHYADRELALAFLMIDNTDKALKHAMLEYARRPNNIDINETVAWVYYKKGDDANAMKYIKKAMVTESQNPVLLSRAGLIALKNKDTVNAKKWLTDALKNNPNIDSDLKTEATEALRKISLL